MRNGNGQKIIVTGTSSFVGSHLAKCFALAGWSVTATLRRPRADYDGIWNARLRWVGDAVAWQILDLRDERAVRKLIAAVKPDLWVHHAGYAVNYASLDFDAQAGQAVNVTPLSCIYEELAKTGQGGVIVTGSGMEYSDTDRACLETDDCKPSTPYGRSKLDQTEMAKKLAVRWRVPTRVARLFIPFGPLDAPAKVVPFVIEYLKKGQFVELSPCTQRRDFLFIKDVVEGYGLLADDLVRGGFDIFNLCGGKAVVIREVLEAIADRLGASRGLLAFGKRPMRPGEPEISYGSNEKILAQLCWRPGSLAQGIDACLHAEKEDCL